MPSSASATGEAATGAGLGRAARKRVPRSSLATYEPAPTRPDPVALLEEQARTRVPELCPIRYGRMLVSPFTFLRGAALVMASDLAAAPRTGLDTQLCGDAHLSNFGLFGSPERQLVFDVNDFDETLRGPFEWDVKRLATSVEVVGRDKGLTPAERERAVGRTVDRYHAAMTTFAGMTTLDVWYAQVSVDRLEAASRQNQSATAKEARRVARKARTRDRLRAVSRLTTTVGGETRFISDPPLLVPISELVPHLDAADLAGRVATALRAYRESLPAERRVLLERYRFVDLARKVVGVGSVGTRAWVVLMMGVDDGDPLVLQLKEAEPSVLERFLVPSRYRNAGQRVVAGQRLMQAASDIFLGWQRMPMDGGERDFYFRQLYDWKGSAEVEDMAAEQLVQYGELCGWTLARAHARSGDRMAIAAYLGSAPTFARAIGAFARAYADQNERDHAALVAARDSGRIVAETPA